LAPILVGLGVVAFAFFWSQAHPSRPMMAIHPSLTSSVGTISQDTTGHHSWTVRNDSESPLALRTHFTSGRCGFSLWLGQERILTPGESFVVSLTWTTPNQGSRTYSNQAEVWTNDPAQPKIVFKVVGKTSKTH
jgi:hypothetical protein